MRISLLILLMLTCAAYGMAGKAPERPLTPTTTGIIIVDDFEDGNYLKDPEWWAFDNIQLRLSSDRALWMRGKASDWYVGGIGTYLYSPERNLSNYHSLEMDITGTGPDSGTLKIELYDDDNRNEQIEQDPKKGYTPVYDDRFSYELKVDWTGRKHVVIPIMEFKDTNPEAGDNVWNPQQLRGSGGLLQMQIIAIAANKTGSVDITLDNIAFSKENGK